jgi:uncharacterized protein (TIGR01777 family)
MTPVFILLACQIALGAFDTLWHHEIKERLPSRRSARHELALHGARELIYAAVFLALAWYDWHGLWSWCFAFVLGIEVVITLADFVIEDRTRRLPKLERVLHTVLALNYGAFIAVLSPVLVDWARAPTAIVAADHGAWSRVLTICALGVTTIGVRNLIAALGFMRPPRWHRDPIRAGSKAQPRTVLVTGATGFIGRHLCRRIIESGDRLIVLTRDNDRAWDLFGAHVQICTSLDQIDSACCIDVIYNLAGARILASWWTARRRHELLNSRLNVTNALVALIARLERKPGVMVSVSAIGYYGVRGEEELTEADRGRPIFQSHLCQAWELAAQNAGNFGVRVVRLRLGLVLGADGGALPQLALSARMHIRTVLGSGAQWVSWIHIHDVLRLMEFCVERNDVRGAFNATAPAPVRQRELADALSAHFGPAIPIRVPDRAMRAMLGEMAQLLVNGQRVLPMRAGCAGFEFLYRDLHAALAQLFPVRSAMTLAPAEILYDSYCPVCDMEMGRYCRSAARAGLAWRFDDVADRAELMSRYRLDLQTARKRVYVLNDAGRMLSGIDALTSIWAALPRWRVLARIVQLPVVGALTAALYDLILAPLIWRWNQRRRSAVGSPLMRA